MNRTKRRVIQVVVGLAAALIVLTLQIDFWLSPAHSHEERPVAQDTSPASPFDRAPIQLTKLANNLYELVGPGGNIAILRGEDGTLLVDSGVASRGRDVAKAVSEISNRPIKTVINTHWHADHTGGNEYLAKVGAQIMAQDNVRQRLSKGQFIEDLSVKVPAAPQTALPVSTLSDAGTLYTNGEEVDLFHVPPAHTDGDLVIYFRNANVLHAGDLFFNGVYPFIDSSSGGWIGGMITAADRILATVDAQTKIIPGHGPLATREDLRRFRTMLVTVRDRIAPLVKAGKTVKEVLAAQPTKDLDDQWGKGYFNGSQFTQFVYNGIVKHDKTTA